MSIVLQNASAAVSDGRLTQQQYYELESVLNVPVKQITPDMILKILPYLAILFPQLTPIIPFIQWLVPIINLINVTPGPTPQPQPVPNPTPGPAPAPVP